MSRDDDFDAHLEQMMGFFEEIQGIPVLLSALTLVLANRPSDKELPCARFDLYKDAFQAVLRQRFDGDEVLQQNVYAIHRCIA